MVLNRRPMNVKKLTDEMKEVKFDVVLEQWQKEKEEELQYILNNNDSIKELREEYIIINESYVLENRKNVLKNGQYFPKVTEKKTSGTMFVQLSKNERELLLSDVADDKTKPGNNTDRVKIADITHIATGLNCKHSNLCKSPSLAFSVLINFTEKQLHFIAEDERMACYWTDAFYILIGNSKRSEYYKNELEELVEMDLRLKIMELQNVSIPKNPPAIPPVPKPPIPPKSPALSDMRSRSKKIGCR
ncbi:hypothetical protein JTB14_000654 [Gonioctena quinquepunctata]|nr:hypothetical protein JTB14_000654 [Gonioctena quinquepunctata]